MPTRFHRLAAALLLAAATTACGSVVASGTVTGTVLDADEVPLPGALVLIGGSPTSTDDAGRFSAAGVVAPYDVAIVGKSAVSPVAMPHVYFGMSDTAPTFRMAYAAEQSAWQGPSCTLVVTIPATSSPSLAASVLLELPKGALWGGAGISGGPSATQRSFNLAWTVAGKVRVHAFESQQDPVTGAPVHYVGYDTTELDLTDGAALQWSPSWKPSPFSEGVVSATVDVPPGYTLDMRLLSTFGSLVAGVEAAPEVSFVVPELPGASFAISAEADGDSGKSFAGSGGWVAPGTQGLHLAIDRAPVLSAPADGGTLGVGSPVTWMIDGEGTPVVVVEPTDPTSPLYYLFGGEGAATFPDLSALGVSLPHDASYTVVVHRDGLDATVDDLAAHGPFRVTGESASHQVTTQ